MKAPTNFVTVDALQLAAGKRSAAPPRPRKTWPNPARSAAAKQVKQLEAELKKLKKNGPRARDGDGGAATTRTSSTRRSACAACKSSAARPCRAVSCTWRWTSEPRRPPSTRAGAGARRLDRQRAESADRARLRQPRLVLALRQRASCARWIFSARRARSRRIPSCSTILAARFVAEGWNVKRLIREIVLSRTWQEAVGQARRRRSGEPPLRPRQSPPARCRAIARHDPRRERRARADYLGPNIAGAGDIDAEQLLRAEHRIRLRLCRYAPQRLHAGLSQQAAGAFRGLRLRRHQPIHRPAQRQHRRPAGALLSIIPSSSSRRAPPRACSDSTAPGGNENASSRRFAAALGRAPSAAELDKCRRFLSAEQPRSKTGRKLQQTLFACLDFRYLD